MFVKDRSENNPEWGAFKHEHFDFESLDQMNDAEIEIMTVARELYPYVPKVIDYDRETKQLTVEKIEGETLDNYLYRTKDTSILEQLRYAISCLRAREVTLQHQGSYREMTGYLAYCDYWDTNFIVDKDRNIWFIDWDIARLLPADRLKYDDKHIDIFIKGSLSRVLAFE